MDRTTCLTPPDTSPVTGPTETVSEHPTLSQLHKTLVVFSNTNPWIILSVTQCAEGTFLNRAEEEVLKESSLIDPHADLQAQCGLQGQGQKNVHCTAAAGVASFIDYGGS